MKRLELGDDYHSSDTDESNNGNQSETDNETYGEESAIEDLHAKLGDMSEISPLNGPGGS